MTEALVVRTEGLTKAYGQRVALTDLCLEIGAGEVFGYLGPNGAGKTTTLRLLAGMLRPTSGRAHVLGYDAWRDSVEVHREMGYLSGEPALYDRLTGREHAAYLGFLRHHVTHDRVEELSVRLDLDLDRPARELSKGNKQKLALVLAMMSTPTLLVLDEPTGGLDPIAQQKFHQILREHTDGGGSVLLSSHVLSEVQRVADRVGVLRLGRLVAVERLDELRSKSLHHVQAQFGEPMALDAFSDVPGLVDLSISDQTMTCSAPQSALDQLLKRFGEHQVVDFECFEASSRKPSSPTTAVVATMLRSVLLKTVRDQRRSLLAWAVSILLLVMMYGAFWPSIRDQPSMNDYLTNLPEALRSLFTMSGADISTPTGYVQIELLSFIGPIVVILYAVSAGNAAVAGEEDRHTMDLLLANPISRTRLVLDKVVRWSSASC